MEYTRSSVGGRVWAEAVLREVGGDVGREAFDLLAGGGRFAVFGFASGAATEATFAEILGKGVTVIGYGGARPWPYPGYPHEREAEALREAAAGRLQSTIGQRFPLEQTAEARAAVESRHGGQDPAHAGVVGDHRSLIRREASAEGHRRLVGSERHGDGRLPPPT